MDEAKWHVAGDYPALKPPDDLPGAFDADAHVTVSIEATLFVAKGSLLRRLSNPCGTHGTATMNDDVVRSRVVHTLRSA